MLFEASACPWARAAMPGERMPSQIGSSARCSRLYIIMLEAHEEEHRPAIECLEYLPRGDGAFKESGTFRPPRAAGPRRGAGQARERVAAPRSHAAAGP